MLTNWSGVSATNSGKPRLVSNDSPARATGVIAHESDDGNALPECVEAGGVSVIRESVEADVDAMVELQIPRAGCLATKVTLSRFTPSSSSKSRVRRRTEPSGARSNSREPIDGLEDLSPQLQDRIVHLAEVVEAAERDAAVLHGRQGADRRFAR